MLTTLSQLKAFAGICGTDVTRDAALAEIIEEANDAVIRYCQNGLLEKTEYTVILDMPSYPSFVLPFAPVHYDPLNVDDPVDLQVWFNPDAQGDPSKFTTDFALDPYTTWTLDVGPLSNLISDSGILRFQSGTLGIGYSRPIYSLSTKVVPLYGCFKAIYTAGYDPVPASLRGAVNLIVMKVFNSRTHGAPLLGESLGGYSYSAQSSATANGILAGDPTVRQMLATFCRPQIGRYA